MIKVPTPKYIMLRQREVASFTISSDVLFLLKTFVTYPNSKEKYGNAIPIIMAAIVPIPIKI